MATSAALDSEEPVPSSVAEAKERADLQRELVQVRERYQSTLQLYSALERQCVQLQRELEAKWSHTFELSSLNLTHVNNSIVATPPTRGAAPTDQHLAPLTDPHLTKLRLATSTPSALQSFDNDSLEGMSSGHKQGSVVPAMKEHILQLDGEKASLEKKLSEVTLFNSRHGTSRDGPSERAGREEVEAYKRQLQGVERSKSLLVDEVVRLKQALQQSSSATVLNSTLQLEVTRLTEENLVRSHSHVPIPVWIPFPYFHSHSHSCPDPPFPYLHSHSCPDPIPVSIPMFLFPFLS